MSFNFNYIRGFTALKDFGKGLAKFGYYLFLVLLGLSVISFWALVYVYVPGLNEYTILILKIFQISISFIIIGGIFYLISHYLLKIVYYKQQLNTIKMLEEMIKKGKKFKNKGKIN